jgi:hypothetical protein
VWTGGVRESIPSNSSDEPTPSLSNHVGSSGVGKTSKRSGREYVITSPVKKKTSSIEDSVREISESIKSKLGEQDSKLLSRMEMMECMKTLAAYDITEGNELYNKAICLLKNDTNRTAFLTMFRILSVVCCCVFSCVRLQSFFGFLLRLVRFKFICNELSRLCIVSNGFFMCAALSQHTVL